MEIRRKYVVERKEYASLEEVPKPGKSARFSITVNGKPLDLYTLALVLGGALTLYFLLSD